MIQCLLCPSDGPLGFWESSPFPLPSFIWRQAGTASRRVACRRREALASEIKSISTGSSVSEAYFLLYLRLSGEFNVEFSFWHFTGTKDRQLNPSLILSPSKSLFFLLFFQTEDMHNQIPWLRNYGALTLSSMLIHELYHVFLCPFFFLPMLWFLEVFWDVAGQALHHNVKTASSRILSVHQASLLTHLRTVLSSGHLWLLLALMTVVVEDGVKERKIQMHTLLFFSLFL